MKKLCLQNLKKSYWEFKEYKENIVDPDELAHYEQPHLDLHCLQISLFFIFITFRVKINK